MVYAIIDANSDYEEMITVAYGERACDAARWFIDEVNDTAQMYLAEQADFDELDKVLTSMEVLADEDSDSTVDDLDGLTVEVGGISVAVVGSFYNYEDMKAALVTFLSDKPKYKKLAVPDNESESVRVIDDLNASLIRCGL